MLGGTLPLLSTFGFRVGKLKAIRKRSPPLRGLIHRSAGRYPRYGHREERSQTTELGGEIVLTGLQAHSRKQTTPQGPHGASSDLVIDASAFKVTVSGIEVPLTRTEYEILFALWGSPGRVLTYEMIAELVWGTCYGVDKRAIEVHVSRLRKKLGECGDSPRFIRNVRGVGYRCELPEVEVCSDRLVGKFKWDAEWNLIDADTSNSRHAPVTAENVMASPVPLPLEPGSVTDRSTLIDVTRLAVDLGIRRSTGFGRVKSRDGDFQEVDFTFDFQVRGGELTGIEMTITERSTGDFRKTPTAPVRNVTGAVQGRMID